MSKINKLFSVSVGDTPNHNQLRHRHYTYIESSDGIHHLFARGGERVIAIVDKDNLRYRVIRTYNQSEVIPNEA